MGFGHRLIACDLLGESTRVDMLYCDGISNKHRGRYEYDYAVGKRSDELVLMAGSGLNG